MAIIDNKIVTPITYIQDLSRHPTPSEAMTYEQLQSKFDQGAEDLRVKHNSLIDNIITNDTAKDLSIANANTKSDNAVNTANSANSAASSADTKATNAVNTSNNANSNASNSLSTANSASTTAINANTKATNVETDYNSVKPQLLQAVNDVALKVNKSYVDEVALNYQNGLMLDNSITNNKMANEMKKSVVGGVASQNDLTILNESLASSLADISSQASGKGASLIGLNDSASKFTATNVEGAMLELFTSANDGKIAVASAITAKGVTASSADTFPTLATKVGQIQQGHGTAVASDLRLGKTASSDIGDITGTTLIPEIQIPLQAGNDLVLNNSTEVYTSSLSYVKLRETKVTKSGTIRVSFDLNCNSAGDARAKIYKNGVAIGTQRANTTTNYITYTEDISGININDLIQIYACSAINSKSSMIKNFSVGVVTSNPLNSSGFANIII